MSDTFLELATERPEELMELFATRGWGDGLPMIPPTEDRVEAMLRATSGDPDEILYQLPPRLGEVTRRAIAVNAVLAGASPELMPVIVTAVRAIGDPLVNIRGINATTHPTAPLVIVHGEAVTDLGFNAGHGSFGPGNRANATVGRAIRFVLLHVGGARPGDGDASTQGAPSKYTYCVAENLPASPWGSYPESIGIDAPSAVTVHCAEGPHNIHEMWHEEPELHLDFIASVMAPMGNNNALASNGEYFVAFGPEHAATISGAGWSRRDVQNYLFERARRPVREMRAHFGGGRAWAGWVEALDDDDLMPLTGHPDNIRIFVTGGPGKHSSVIPSWGGTRSVTLPVEA